MLIRVEWALYHLELSFGKTAVEVSTVGHKSLASTMANGHIAAQYRYVRGKGAFALDLRVPQGRHLTASDMQEVLKVIPETEWLWDQEGDRAYRPGEARKMAA